MPTINILLTQSEVEFIDGVVRAGEYRNADDVMQDALRALRQRRQEDALRLEALDTLVRAGAKALSEGDFVELDDAELDRFVTAFNDMLRTRGS